MKKYECIIILDDRKIENTGEAFIKTVEKQISSLGGEILETENMGRKQLAYQIKRRNAGVYWSILFNIAPDKVASLKDAYKLEEKILRLAVYVYDVPEMTRIPLDKEAANA